MPPVRTAEVVFSRLTRGIEILLACLTVAGLLSILVVTLVDVIGRYFFNSPLSGGGELVSLSLAMSIFSAIPLVTAKRGDIAMTAVKDLTSGWVARLLDVLILSGGTLVSGFFAYRIWLRGNYLSETGEYTEVLHIPLAPAVFVVAVSWGLTALVFAWLGLVAMLGRGEEASDQ